MIPPTVAEGTYLSAQTHNLSIYHTRTWHRSKISTIPEAGLEGNENLTIKKLLHCISSVAPRNNNTVYSYIYIMTDYNNLGRNLLSTVQLYSMSMTRQCLNKPGTTNRIRTWRPWRHYRFNHKNTYSRRWCRLQPMLQSRQHLRAAGPQSQHNGPHEALFVRRDSPVVSSYGQSLLLAAIRNPLPA